MEASKFVDISSNQNRSPMLTITFFLIQMVSLPSFSGWEIKLDFSYLLHLLTPIRFILIYPTWNNFCSGSIPDAHCLVEKGTFCYINDILETVKNDDEYLQMLAKVLHKLKIYGICKKKIKYFFMHVSVEYLGYKRAYIPYLRKSWLFWRLLYQRQFTRSDHFWTNQKFLPWLAAAVKLLNENDLLHKDHLCKWLTPIPLQWWINS